MRHNCWCLGFRVTFYIFARLRWWWQSEFWQCANLLPPSWWKGGEGSLDREQHSKFNDGSHDDDVCVDCFVFGNSDDHIHQRVWQLVIDKVTDNGINSSISPTVGGCELGGSKLTLKPYYGAFSGNLKRMFLRKMHFYFHPFQPKTTIFGLLRGHFWPKTWKIKCFQFIQSKI